MSTKEGYTKPTRGSGLLEGLLAKKRARIANALIPPEKRNGRLLDVGCGTFPYFLNNTSFKEKFGIDKGIGSGVVQAGPLSLSSFDFENDDTLPFREGYFDVVTMLAVIEHLEPDRVAGVLNECRRVLNDGGLLIITTPAFWTDKLLRMMAALGLVSPEEILEHKDVYSHSKIAALLCKGGFSQGKMRSGYFELFMNLWTVAAK
ncbi:MAG: class I SAM-dependent methyltransferase [Nitrospirae bacterium]|nr:class I SAM-dependent methyltransferase [Nitrospirota bacterium]